MSPPHSPSEPASAPFLRWPGRRPLRRLGHVCEGHGPSGLGALPPTPPGGRPPANAPPLRGLNLYPMSHPSRAGPGGSSWDTSRCRRGQPAGYKKTRGKGNSETSRPAYPPLPETPSRVQPQACSDHTAPGSHPGAAQEGVSGRAAQAPGRRQSTNCLPQPGPSGRRPPPC